MTQRASRGLYVVFDGPPSHESGRFVELETDRGASTGSASSGADWAQEGDLWSLGPFASSREYDALKEAHGRMHRAKKLTAATCLMCPVILDHEVAARTTIAASQQRGP